MVYNIQRPLNDSDFAFSVAQIQMDSEMKTHTHAGPRSRRGACLFVLDFFSDSIFLN